RLPTQTQWKVTTADDGQFFATGIPPATTGVISFLSIRDCSEHVEWQDEAPGFKAERAFVSFKNVAPGNYVGVEVYYTLEGSATGRVIDEQGNGVEGVWVEATPRGQPDGNAIFKTDKKGGFKAKLPANESICLKVLSEGLAEN